MKRRSRARWIECSRYASRCGACGADLPTGSRILWRPADSNLCSACGEAQEQAARGLRRRERERAALTGYVVARVYEGSDGALTTQLLRALKGRGPEGQIAALLFRAQKSSSRAKRYGMTSYRGLSYARKGESLKELCDALESHGAAFGISFGWGRDEGSFDPWVLYVDLPELGQVSFHSPERYAGPDYPADWDGRRASEERIICYCQRIVGT